MRKTNPAKKKAPRTNIPKQRNNFLFYLGNLMIILSLLSFLVIFWPIITTYFAPREIKDPATLSGFHLTVPEIKAQSPVVENVDPFDQAKYEEALKRGIAHAEGTSLPEQNGNVFLFAHSSGAPWELASYNTVFMRLGELDEGDEIILTKDKKVYRYKVVGERTVWPWDTEVLYEDKNQLVLQTCYPIGTSLKRLLIFAEPV